MKVSAATARRFSEVLLHVYAAASDAAVWGVLAEAEKTIGIDGQNRWLLGLLRGHAEHRREQLLQGKPAEIPAAIANLTRREQEVLQQIALGETDAAIGRTLGIASKTASKHVENILRKLGVETRTAAASALRPPP